jgi:hypothetical protein
MKVFDSANDGRAKNLGVPPMYLTPWLNHAGFEPSCGVGSPRRTQGTAQIRRGRGAYQWQDLGRAEIFAYRAHSLASNHSLLTPTEYVNELA